MAKMSRFEFDKKTREKIYSRDQYRCINCHDTGMLGVAHVFVPRSKGGLGVEENGVLMCQRCHHEMDNGRVKEISEMIKKVAEEYLKKQYHIDLEKIIYNKWKNYPVK
jgi:5-methylcytosine-specific restriction endonuclease McrA